MTVFVRITHLIVENIFELATMDVLTTEDIDVESFKGERGVMY